MIYFKAFYQINHRNGSNLCSFPILLSKREINLGVLSLNQPFPYIFPSETADDKSQQPISSLDIPYCSSISHNEVI